MSPRTSPVRTQSPIRLLALVLICISTIIVASLASAQSTAPETGYTKLTHPPCKTIHVQTEGANSEQLCPGMDGYSLLLLDSDGRMSVTVVSPDGSRHPLDFWTTVTPHFSAVGKTAAWRIRSGLPSALIVPLTIQEDANTGRSVPYRIVVKLTLQNSCVVAKLPMTSGMETIDRAVNESCPAR